MKQEDERLVPRNAVTVLNTSRFGARRMTEPETTIKGQPIVIRCAVYLGVPTILAMLPSHYQVYVSLDCVKARPAIRQLSNEGSRICA